MGLRARKVAGACHENLAFRAEPAQRRRVDQPRAVAFERGAVAGFGVFRRPPFLIMPAQPRAAPVPARAQRAASRRCGTPRPAVAALARRCRHTGARRATLCTRRFLRGAVQVDDELVHAHAPADAHELGTVRSVDAQRATASTHACATWRTPRPRSRARRSTTTWCARASRCTGTRRRCVRRRSAWPRTGRCCWRSAHRTARTADC